MLKSCARCGAGTVLQVISLTVGVGRGLHTWDDLARNTHGWRLNFGRIGGDGTGTKRGEAEESLVEQMNVVVVRSHSEQRVGSDRGVVMLPS